MSVIESLYYRSGRTNANPHSCQLKDVSSCRSESTPNALLVFGGFSTPLNTIRVFSVDLDFIGLGSQNWADKALLQERLGAKLTAMGRANAKPDIQCDCKILTFVMKCTRKTEN